MALFLCPNSLHASFYSSMQTHYTSSYLVLELTFDDGEVIDAEMDRWAFNRPGQPNTDLTPIQKNEVKEFIAMTREPDFNVRNTSCNFISL